MGAQLPRFSGQRRAPEHPRCCIHPLRTRLPHKQSWRWVNLRCSWKELILSMLLLLSLFSYVQLCVTPWTVAHQAPLSPGFSRHEHWSGLPCPPPGDLPNPGIEPASLRSLALTGGFFTTSTTWEVHTQHRKNNNHTDIVERMFKILAWKTTAPLEPGYLRHCCALFLD